MAEPLYDPEVDTWLDSLVDTNPELLERIEGQIDLLRDEPIGAKARRREFRSQDGGSHYVISFDAQSETWLLVWIANPDGEPVVVAITRTVSL
jgi:hypothetical protein